MFGLSQHLLMKAGHLTSLTKTEVIIDLGTRTYWSQWEWDKS